MLSIIITLCISFSYVTLHTNKRSSHGQFRLQHVFRGQRRHHRSSASTTGPSSLNRPLLNPRNYTILRDHQTPPPKHSGFSASSHAPMWLSFPRLPWRAYTSLVRGIRLHNTAHWNVPPSHSPPPFSIKNSDAAPLRQAFLGTRIEINTVVPIWYVSDFIWHVSATESTFASI
jgi:hypothetical protein